MGSRSAKVVLLESSDFQCPYCARAVQDALPTVFEKYVKAGKVQMVFKHLPLERIHPLAFKAAEAAECAGRQGHFWEMHDTMFRQRGRLDPASLREHAISIGLDNAQFLACFDKGEMVAKIRRGPDEARKLQISGTPTFLVGTLQPGDRVRALRRAANTAKALEESLDALLREAATGSLRAVPVRSTKLAKPVRKFGSVL